MTRLTKTLLMAISLSFAVVLVIIAGKVYAIEDGPTSAYLAAEDIVSKQLKSPASAQFPSWVTGRDSIHVEPSGDGYSVSSWVDADNTFGAKLRSRWTCQVSKNGPLFDGACRFEDHAGIEK